jgi:hypothetical protein
VGFSSRPLAARSGLRLRFAGILLGAVAALALGSLAPAAQADFGGTPVVVGAGTVKDGTFYDCGGSPQGNGTVTSCSSSAWHSSGCSGSI